VKDDTSTKTIGNIENAFPYIQPHCVKVGFCQGKSGMSLLLVFFLEIFLIDIFLMLILLSL
jgi:hypothetical protein